MRETDTHPYVPPPALMPHELAVIIVSANSARWLTACLSTLFEHLGDLDADVVVADNRSTDGTQDLVRQSFSAARVVVCDNRGFAHANNRALMTVNARYVAFLNPDTEILQGSFGDLVAYMDVSPAIGLVGVRQVTSDGELFPTIRRFPNAVRAFWEALGSEWYPFHASWLGERERELSRYEVETSCDWTSGSFMFARREALESAGYLDERFFLFSEETDLCLRIKQAGWQIRHLPTMTVLHHGREAVDPRFAAQDAFTRRLYSGKHFSPVHRVAYLGALGLGYTVRSIAPGRDADYARERRKASRAALAALIGLAPPPFGEPPDVALAERSKSGIVA